MRIPFSDIPTPVVASSDTVVVVTCEGQKGALFRISALDADTGAPKWMSPPVSSVHSLAASESTLLAVVDSRLRAYDLATGQLLWETEELRGHTRYRIDPVVGPTSAVYWVDDSRGRWEQVIDYYDVAKGGLLEEDRIPSEYDSLLLLRSGLVDYWTGAGATISATQRDSRKTLWQVPGNRKVQPWPWVISGLVAFSSGIFPVLETRDALSGSQIWAYPTPLVSNVAMSDQGLYAIEQTGSVIAIDSLSGAMLELARMARPYTESESRSTGYWVAATSDIVFAYYGDSQELIALSIQND